MNPKQDDLFERYLSTHLSQTVNSKTRQTKKQRLVQNYSDFLPALKSSPILEIGPGFGELLELLTNDLSYSNVKSVDLSQEVVNFCNSIIPNIAVKTDSTQEFLHGIDEKLNAVFMLHVLEHIPKKDTFSMLSAIHNSLAPEGILVVEVPNMANPITGLNIRYADFTHEAGFTEISLKYVLYKSGFTNVTVYPSKLPTNSVPRHIQSFLQMTVNGAFNLLRRIYMPSQSQIMSPAIFAVAVK
jgi:2-polyprenyl-3-methyl-5-hydroxy-6-metoxy-1,4-benzoquinol methylase